VPWLKAGVKELQQRLTELVKRCGLLAHPGATGGARQQVGGREAEAPAAAGATAADGVDADGAIQRRLPAPAPGSLATGFVRLGPLICPLR